MFNTIKRLILNVKGISKKKKILSRKCQKHKL